MDLAPMGYDYAADIKKLYKQAFPRKERKPMHLMRRRRKKYALEILAILDEGAFVGLAITMLYEDLVLLDYFAIVPELRNKGLGSQGLQLVRDRYPRKRLLVEIEAAGVTADNMMDRHRRRVFYNRAGFADTYMRVSICGVKMDVLADNCSVTFAEYRKLYRKSLGFLSSIGRSPKLVDEHF